MSKYIDAEKLIKRINNAEENFKFDNMETIGSDIDDPFVDGVLSGVFNIREMVNQADSENVIPLDKVEQIRSEIESRLQGVNIALDVLTKDHALIPRMEAAKTTWEEVLDIFDKALKEQNE